MNSHRTKLTALALVAAILLGSTSGCVMFGTTLYESEWEPDDAAFAVEVTVPLAKNERIAARPHLVPDDAPLAKMYDAQLLPEGERGAASSLQ
jgi:hypothetical protein